MAGDEGRHSGVGFEMWSAFAHVRAADGRAFSVVTFFFTGKFLAFNVSGVYAAVLDVRRDRFVDSRDMVAPIFGSRTSTRGRLDERFDDNLLRRDTATGTYEIRIATGTLDYALSGTAARAPLDLGMVPAGPGRLQRSYVFPRMSMRGVLRLEDGEQVEVEGVGLFQHVWGDSPDGSAAQDVIVAHLEDGTDFVAFSGADPDSAIMVLSSDSAGRVLRDAFQLVTDTAFTDSSFSFRRGWRIRVPDSRLDVRITPRSGRRVTLLGIPYLLGRCEVVGERAGKPVSGIAYVYVRGRMPAGTAETVPDRGSIPAPAIVNAGVAAAARRRAESRRTAAAPRHPGSAGSASRFTRFQP